jgi:hypothetical protein
MQYEHRKTSLETQQRESFKRQRRHFSGDGNPVASITAALLKSRLAGTRLDDGIYPGLEREALKIIDQGMLIN